MKFEPQNVQFKKSSEELKLLSAVLSSLIKPDIVKLPVATHLSNADVYLHA